MKLKIYSIKDNLGGFYQPTFELSDEVAIRNFSFAINKKENILYASADDFSLYNLGVFDTELGTIEPVNPALIVHGSSLLKEEKDGK